MRSLFNDTVDWRLQLLLYDLHNDRCQSNEIFWKMCVCGHNRIKSNQIKSIAIMHISFSFSFRFNSIHHGLNMERRNCSCYRHHHHIFFQHAQHLKLFKSVSITIYSSFDRFNMQSTKINIQVVQKKKRTRNWLFLTSTRPSTFVYWN